MEKAMNDLLEFLTHVPLFSSVPSDEINKIASFFYKETYKKDQTICSQGEVGDSMFIIRSGIVSILKNIDGDEVISADLQRGDFFGEVALLSKSPRNATAKVSIDATVYRLTRENFEELLKNNKSIGLYLSRYYARRMTNQFNFEKKTEKNRPVFYAVSATEKNLGISYFLYTASYHISTESKKNTLIIEPYKEPEELLQGYGLKKDICPDRGLFFLLPENSYKADDINWFKHESGFSVLQLETGFSNRLYEAMPALMEGLRKNFDIIIFNMSHRLGNIERLFIRLCDRTLILINNTWEKVDIVKKRIQEIEKICGSSAFLGRIRVGVSHLCGKKGIPRKELQKILNLSEIPEIWVDRSDKALSDRIDTKKHFPVKGPRAVAREIAGIRVGLALGAGAARGWAHIGVLKVLEDAGIHVDMISGASMGALVGGVYAATASVEELKKNTIDKLKDKRSIRKKIFDYTIPVQGLIKGGKISRLIRTSIDNADFLDLLIPAYISSVDIIKGEEVVFEEGDVTDAIRSSISIPAVFSPYLYMGRWMVDGALLNPVPVDVLLRKGADIVIAVCIEPRGGSGGSENHSIGIKSVVSRTISIVHGRATNDFAKNADIVLYPDINDFAWDDFHKGLKLMIKGMEACIERLDDIKKVIELRTKNNG